MLIQIYAIALREMKTYSRRRLLLFKDSSASSFRSPTRLRNSTFSKYPPLLRLALNSSATDDPAADSVWRWDFQSMADLSSVVNFLALPEPGRGARVILDFRGPARFGCGFGTEGGIGSDVDRVVSTHMFCKDLSS